MAPSACAVSDAGERDLRACCRERTVVQGEIRQDPVAIPGERSPDELVRELAGVGEIAHVDVVPRGPQQLALVAGGVEVGQAAFEGGVMVRKLDVVLA